MNLFTSLDPSVKKLLGWRMGDDEEKWALKAIESLVKKLRKRKAYGSSSAGRGSIEDLEYALAHPGSHSRCVTIPRSLDGRLQVSHRKGLPHVIYCRVWRWPTLQSHHELRPLPNCLYPYDARQEHICINPYHYQRVDSMAGDGFAGHHTAVGQIPSFRQTPLPPTHHPHHIPVAQQHLPTREVSMDVSSNATTPDGKSSVFDYTPSISPILTERQPSYSPTGSAFFSVGLGTGCNATSPSALSDDDEQLANVNNTATCQAILAGRNDSRTLQDDYSPWCSISYYELNSHVGEAFKVATPSVVIDGGVSPGGEHSQVETRVCLGPLSNVNRNNTVEITRRHIGKGIRLVDTGAYVLLENLSEGSVFVQSRNSNIKINLQPTAVCRVPAHSSFLLFDYHLFSNMLEKAKCEGYHHVYELQKHCFIRISLIKGWGADYHRQDITSTPCWMEVQLHKPLLWIDSTLELMVPPNHLNVTSVS